MLLHCVRHGETISNAQGRIQGQLDVPLSDLGRRQSEALARTLANRRIDAVYSSTLVRAFETAQIVAEALGVDVRPDERLKEIHAGIFQGKLRSEIDRLYPAEMAQWLRGDPDYVIPGGESLGQLRERGLAALADIRRAGHRQAVVVAHGRLLTVTLKALLRIPLAGPPKSLQNASLTTLDFGPDGRAKMRTMDEIGHLDGVGLSGRGDL